MGIFSIIMPCYNVESLVAKTIQSVLNQSYTDFELIMVDDGSTDNTYKIIEEISKRDKRIKTYCKENGGVSSARNYGLTKATGDYLYFLDADDLISDNLLEKAYKVFGSHSIDMFSFGYKMVAQKDNREIKNYCFEKYSNKVFRGEEFQKLYFYKRISQHICSFIVKREIVTSNSLLFDENTKYAEDQEFQIRCNMKCSLIYYEATDYFHYVSRLGSAMNQPIIRDNFDVYFRMKEYIDGSLDESYNNYLSFVFLVNLREILVKGSNKQTVFKLLEIDFILKRFKTDKSLLSLKTRVSIILYYLVIKKIIKKKYRI